MHNIDKKILNKLENVTKSGSGWRASCPACSDKNTNLSVTRGDDGRILINCFVGCRPEEIVKKIGLEMKDLFPNKKHFPALKPSAPTIINLGVKMGKRKWTQSKN